MIYQFFGHSFIHTYSHSFIHSINLFVNYSLIFYSLGVRDMVGKVIQLAAEDSTQNKDGQSSVVVICGTGYIMPDARLELGIKEPRYPPSLPSPPFLLFLSFIFAFTLFYSFVFSL